MRLQIIRSALQNEEGVSLTELAFMLPILMLIITGLTDVAAGFAAKIALQQATARTIEKASAGGLNSGAFANLQTEGATAAGVAESQVTVDKWLECDGQRQLDFNGVCSDIQEVGRYVSINIKGKYTPLFSFVKWGTSADGSLPLTATSSVRVQ